MIDSRIAVQVFNGKTVALQARADFTYFVEDSDHAAKFIVQETKHLIHQHFRAAYSQRMNHMTYRRAIVRTVDARD